MNLWRSNRLDQAWELPNEEVAQRFLTSRFGDTDQYPWPLERALAAFISFPESDGGLESVFETDSHQGARDWTAVQIAVLDHRSNR